jgi:hypothetical protein
VTQAEGGGGYTEFLLGRAHLLNSTGPGLCGWCSMVRHGRHGRQRGSSASLTLHSTIFKNGVIPSGFIARTLKYA